MKLPHVKTEPRALASGGVKSSQRPSFTLVELLVVIAIIGVLASLLLAAVFKALDVAYEAQTRTDITQLSASVQAFQTQFKVNYIPSRIVLCKVVTDYYQSPGVFKSQLHQDSLEYLSRVWPRLDWGTPQPQGGPYIWQGIDWDPISSVQVTGLAKGQPYFLLWNGTQFIQVTEVDLEGEQALVFFLGGLGQVNLNAQGNPDGTFTALGFSTNVSNPMLVVGDRVAPFFEFKSNRLMQWANTAPWFPSYIDGYGKTPYAYFSSYKTANGYNRYFAIPNPYMPPPNPYPSPPYTNPPYPPQAYYSDCQALQFPPLPPVPGAPPQPQGVWPYAQNWSPTPQYLNSQTFQIISAGKNYHFGLGAYPPGDPNYPPTAWAASRASAVSPQGSDGYDDISNFYDRLLGVASQ